MHGKQLKSAPEGRSALSFQPTIFLAISIFVVGFITQPTEAQITRSGGVFSSNSFQNPTWDAGNTLFVGYQTDGSVVIGSGGVVTSTDMLIGLFSGIAGSVDVNGGILTAATLGIGGDTGGTLLIRNGGSVALPVRPSGETATTLFIQGESGLVHVSGGTLTSGNSLLMAGNVRLEISDTGAVNSESAEILVGTADVRGGSWNLTNSLDIAFGQGGRALLDVSGSGSVVASTINANGEVLVRESGSVSASTLNFDGSAEIRGGTMSASSRLAISSQDFDNGVLTMIGGQVTASQVVVALGKNSNGTLHLNGGVFTTGNLMAAPNRVFFGTTETAAVRFNGGTLQLAGAVSQLFTSFRPGEITLEPGGGTLDTQEFAASTGYGLTGAGGLTKAGTGTLTLSGANTYTGGTTVSAGTLAITGSIHHPDSNLNVSGTLRISGNGAVSNLSGRIGVSNPGAVEVSGGTWTNSSTLFVGISHDSTFEMTGGNVSANSVFLGTPLTAISKGTFHLNGGTLTTTQVAEGPSGGGFRFGGGTLRLSANQGNLFGTFEPGDVTLAEGGGTIDTQGFAVTSGYALSGVGGLTKSGSGTLTLTGANSYIGKTTIQAGTLSLGSSGSLNGSSGIDIASGATLDASGLPGGLILGTSQTLSGNGTLLGNVTTAGTLSPGNSIGQLQFTGNLQLDSAAVIQMEIASLSDFDRTIVNGMLAYDGNLLLAFRDGYVPGDGDSFELFEGFSSYNGTFDEITMPIPGYAASFDYSTGRLTFTVIPEPGSFVFLGITALATAFFGRHRRLAC